MSDRNYRRDPSDTDPHRSFIRVLDAIEDWHHHSETVFERMAVAAESLGWPDSMVRDSKSQLMQAAQAQTQMLEQLIDAWRDRMDGRVSELQLLGNETSKNAVPASDGEAIGTVALEPAQLWIDATVAWQKKWADAMQAWTLVPERFRQNDDQ